MKACLIRQLLSFCSSTNVVSELEVSVAKSARDKIIDDLIRE